MDVFVVIDTLGDGRIVGVFSSEESAREVIGEWGHYYKLHPCRMNRVDPAILGWARSDEQRRWLERFVSPAGSTD
jgi:hypothetical protein